MDSDALADLLFQLRAGLDDLYGERLARVILYGSQARGDAHDESDVDVAVVLRGDVNAYDELDRTSALTTRLTLRFGVAVSVFALAEARLAHSDHPLAPSLLREGVSV
jgi:predicted nucleotidyltransferase